MILQLTRFWMPSLDDLRLFAPELAVVGTIVLLLVLPLIMGKSARLAGGVVAGGILVAMWLTWRLSVQVAGGGSTGLAPAAAGGMLIADNLSVFFKLTLLLFAAGVLGLWWIGSASTEKDATEFFVLLLGSAVGMMLMVSTLNVLMIVIAIEMASLPSYAIVGFQKRDKQAAEVSLKYAIFGAISAALMLYGASLLYGLYGTLGVPAIAQGVVADLVAGRNLVALAAGLLGLFCGMAFKISAVPFHFWCPDAFQGARIEVTTWLSVVSKAAGLMLLMRVVHAFAAAAEARFVMELMGPLAWAIGIVAILTCSVGNFAAYKQTSVKRLLAYSSIAHAGYMLMAVAIFAAPGGPGATSATAALLFYVLVYLFMNLGAFGVTALVYWQTGSDSLDAFNGLMRRAPWLALPMLFCLMSLVGLPPFAGFMGKYWILYALAQQGSGADWLYWVLFVVAVINTLISLYYYMRIVVRMMLVDDGQPAVKASPAGSVVVNICGIMLVVMLVFAGPFKRATDRFSKNLYHPATSKRMAYDESIGEQVAKASDDAGVDAR